MELYRLIKDNEVKISELVKYQKYYETKNTEIEKRIKDDHKANNKLKHSIAKYIVDVATGYFLGKPISYSSEDENYIEKVKEILDNNHEQDLNYEIAKQTDIKGYCYELLYTNQEGQVKMKRVDAENGILIKDNTLEENITCFIRYWKEYKDLSECKKDEVNWYYKCEVYNSETVELYKVENSRQVLIEEYRHLFNEVPVVEYVNNEECQGSIEPILDLVDEYDKLQSDTANDFEEFTDCYMVWKGTQGAVDGEEFVRNIKEYRQIFLDNDDTVEFLTKQMNDQANENYKDRVMQDIHKFSMTPNITDENFSGNASGVAMKYKLYGLEQKTSIKERKFKKGLERRFKLISNILRISQAFEDTKISMQFSRNFVQSNKEDVETSLIASQILSKKTSLGLLPFIEDVNRELERIKEEEEERANSIFSDIERENGDIDED